MHPPPVQELDAPLFRAQGVRLLVERDDLVGDGAVSGNKFRKLRLNLAAAHDQGATTLLTFGGAYSNHLRAVAEAGRRHGLRTIGIVRGDEPRELNWSLRAAAEAGMHLVQVDRATYRQRAEPAYVDELRSRFGDFYLVPEGGSNPLGVRGCAELVQEIAEPFDVIYCGCGTGGTLAGIAYALGPQQRAVGVAAFGGPEFLRREVADHQVAAFGTATANWTVEAVGELGRFAKVTPRLAAFVDEFADRHGIQLETTYVARTMYRLFQDVRDGRLNPGDTVVAVVTGPAARPTPPTRQPADPARPTGSTRAATGVLGEDVREDR